MPPDLHRHLPRLGVEAYRGCQFVHWTMAIAGRKTGWLNPALHAKLRTILHRNAEHHGVVAPVYCFMPDHLHLLAVGLYPSSNQLNWARTVRRAINQALRPVRLQKQAFDHVLRPDETGPDAFSSLARYISENPVRAGLSPSAEGWPYSGSVVPALPHLDPRQPGFRDDWWHYWISMGGYP